MPERDREDDAEREQARTRQGESLRVHRRDLCPLRRAATQRRRAELGATIGLLLLLNLLVWLVRDDWAARAGALVVSLVVFPVVRLMVTRR